MYPSKFFRFSVLINFRYTISNEMSSETNIAHKFYSLTPLKLGMEVHGIDLKSDVSEEVVTQIREDVTKHRILVFRNQNNISGQRHVEISKWFGELESTFYKHPRSPHPDVFRVSNNDIEGCTGVGRTGWHIDGSFQPAPFSHSLYHIVSVPKKGDTVFAPLTELIDRLAPEKKERWERLWMVADRRSNVVHPLIYNHPITGKLTLCFHLGMTEAFIWDFDSQKPRKTNMRETMEILQEIHNEFIKDNNSIQYSHKWTKGDFIISDNLAVGHEASETTQYPVEEVGLRVMHRTTVKGENPPAKKAHVKEEL